MPARDVSTCQRLAIVFLAFAVLGAALHAQAVRGSLLGTVTDFSGAVVPGARIVLSEGLTGMTRQIEPGQSGTYSTPNLDAGTYRLTVEMALVRYIEVYGPATYGTVRWTILNGPGLVNLDFSLFRKIRLSEPMEIEFRFESFNLSNTPHVSSPDTALGAAAFGRATTAEGRFRPKSN